MVVEYDMSDDMAKADWLVAKVKASESYAQNLYAAMCNMRWQKLDVFPILKEELWSVTWRSAGGIVAELQGQGDYLSWYCSGIGGANGYEDDIREGFVNESVVTDEIREDLRKLGWHPVPYNEDDR